MGIFDSYTDAANQIKTEGETIGVSVKLGVPETGQATIEWNIPGAAGGCGVGAVTGGAYCGALVTLSDTPQQSTELPEDGIFYTADLTADPDTHAGDMIGNARVVAAFYEGEKKGQGQPMTASVVINDIKSTTPYYFSVHAVDCQGRYHRDGIRGFSDKMGRPDELDTPSTQTVQMEQGEGVLPTDGTNLIPGMIYEFDIEVNENFPSNPTPNDIVNIKIDGTDAQTYGDLVDQVNQQLAAAENAPQSPIPPNTGTYLVDTSDAKLYLHNGTNYDEVPALFETADPADIVEGEYWYDPSNQILNIRDANDTWIPTEVIQYPTNPAEPACDDFWFNGSQLYKHNGSVWCEVSTTASDTDPSLDPGGECGLYWYSPTSSELSVWNDDTNSFDPTQALFWDVAPNEFVENTLWYDIIQNKLFRRTATDTWEEIEDVATQSVTPTENIAEYWYDPEHDTLRTYTDIAGPGGNWVDVDFVSWAEDPTIVESCTLWWDSVNDQLMVWDIINSVWEPVPRFVQSENNPTLAIPPESGDAWFDSSTGTVNIWDGTQWAPTPAITTPNTPDNLPDGTAWLDTTTGDINVLNEPSAGWNEIDPVDSVDDPTTIQSGSFWFDITTSTLHERIGSAWTPIPYHTQPLFPAKGDKWFDTNTNQLMEWNGSAWVEGKAIVEFGLTPNGDLAIQTRKRGCAVSVMIMVPGGNIPRGTGKGEFHSFGHDFTYSPNKFTAPKVLTTAVSEEAFLFNNLPARILPQRYGTDGVEGIPMYDVIGVGTDGTPEERRELADTIRIQLGYPVVEVELTPQQIDIAIQSAIESIRKRGDIAYNRGFFILDIEPGCQKYILSNKCAGFDRIVGITKISRMSSSFLSAAHGAGPYGQVVLQHLYNMGTYDLTSFHLVSQYIEQMEHLFATNIMFHFNEYSRELHMHQAFRYRERVLMDCYVERTEQELFLDRWAKSWIEKYALAQCRLMLGEIRGKFGSLPGAGGGVTLNASELMARADADIQELYSQLDDYVTSHVEQHGNTHFILG